MEVSGPPCDGGRGGILFEKESYSEKYIGQNAYGAIAKVREETTIQYCLIDLSAHRAKFQLLKSKKINKNNLVVVGRGRIDLSIKDDYSSHKPTFNVPLDSMSGILKRVFCLADAAHGDRAVSCPYPATGRQKIPLD